MLTSIDKFLAALLAVIIYAVTEFFGVVEILGLDLLDPETVNSFIANTVVFLTPFLVWLIPNKE